MNTNFDDPKFLKWAQIFYGITFVFMCLGVLHFYDIDRLLGPLSISIGRMLGDLARFVFILVIFLIPYGIVTTALLYPNELRLSESLEGIFFKPVLTLYGEMFLSEYTDYDFNDGLTCSKTSNIVELMTTNSEYSAFGFVERSELFNNFSHSWQDDDQPIREWDLCADHGIGFEIAHFFDEVELFKNLHKECMQFNLPRSIW